MPEIQISEALERQLESVADDEEYEEVLWKMLYRKQRMRTE